ncbi:hypothetical protein [Lysobacter gummosus]|uniref:hypothetical protein n=1 Tax=Lysobacter gummosus TaxID=262324 RepID=UPI003635DBA2
MRSQGHGMDSRIRHKGNQGTSVNQEIARTQGVRSRTMSFAIAAPIACLRIRFPASSPHRSRKLRSSA